MGATEPHGPSLLSFLKKSNYTFWESFRGPWRGSSHLGGGCSFFLGFAYVSDEPRRRTRTWGWDSRCRLSCRGRFLLFGQESIGCGRDHGR